MNTKKRKEHAVNNSINMKYRKINNQVQIKKTNPDDCSKKFKLSRFDHLDSDFSLSGSQRECKKIEDSLVNIKKKKWQINNKELLGRKKKKPKSSVQSFENNLNKNFKESELMKKDEYNEILSNFRDELFEIIPEKKIQNKINDTNENSKKFINFIDKSDKIDNKENKILCEKIGNFEDNYFQTINTSTITKKFSDQKNEKYGLNDFDKINIHGKNKSKLNTFDHASIFSDVDANKSINKLNYDRDIPESNFKSEYNYKEKGKNQFCYSNDLRKNFFNQNLLIMCKNFFNYLKPENNKHCKMIDSILLNNTDFDINSNKNFYKILKEKYSEIYTVVDNDNKFFSDLSKDKLLIEDDKSIFYSYLLKNINDFHLYNITSPKIFEIFQEFNRNFNFKDEEDQDSNNSKDGDFHLLKSSYNKNFNYRLNSTAFNLKRKLKKKHLKKKKKDYTMIEIDKNEKDEDLRVNITLNNSNLSLEEDYANDNNTNLVNFNQCKCNLNIENHMNSSETSYDEKKEMGGIFSFSEYSSSKVSDNENQENNKFIEDDFCFTNLNWKELEKKENIQNDNSIENNSLFEEKESKLSNEDINYQNNNKKKNYLSNEKDLNKMIATVENKKILENKFEFINEKTKNIPAILNENMFCFPFHEKFISLENLEQEMKISFKKEINENSINLINEDSNKIKTPNDKEKIENKVTLEMFSKIHNEQKDDLNNRDLKPSLDKLKEEGLDSYISSTNFIENYKSKKKMNGLNNISLENESLLIKASNIDLKNDLDYSKDNIDFQIDIENDIELGIQNNSNLIRIEIDEDTKILIQKNFRRENEKQENKNISTKIIRNNQSDQDYKQCNIRNRYKDLHENSLEGINNKLKKMYEKEEQSKYKSKNSSIHYNKSYSENDKEVYPEKNNIIKIAKSDIICSLSSYPLKDKIVHNGNLSINRKEKLTYRKLLIKKLNFLKKKKNKQEIDFKILQDSDILKSLIYVVNRKFISRYNQKDPKLEKSLMYLKENLEKLKLKNLKISINKKYKEDVGSELNGFLNISENKKYIDMQFSNLKKFLLNKSIEDKFTLLNMNNNFRNSLNLNKYFFQKNVNNSLKFKNRENSISYPENETEEFNLDEIFCLNKENLNIEINLNRNEKEEVLKKDSTIENDIEDMKQTEEIQLRNINQNEYFKKKNNNKILIPVDFKFDKENINSKNLEDKIKYFLQNLDNLSFLTEKATKTDSNTAAFVDLFKIFYCLDDISEEKNYEIFAKNFSYDNFIHNKGIANQFVEEIKKFTTKCRKYSSKKSDHKTNNIQISKSKNKKIKNSCMKKFSSIRVHKKGNIAVDFQDDKNDKIYNQIKDDNQPNSKNFEEVFIHKKNENMKDLDLFNKEKNDSTETNEDDDVNTACDNKGFSMAFNNDFNKNKNIIEDINKNNFLKKENNCKEKDNFEENSNKKTSFIILKTPDRNVKHFENYFKNEKEEISYNNSSTDQNNNNIFLENELIGIKKYLIKKKEKYLNEEHFNKNNRKIKEQNSKTLVKKNIFDSFKDFSDYKNSEEKSIEKKCDIKTKIKENLLIDKNNNLQETNSSSRIKIQYDNIIKIDTEMLNNLNYFNKNEYIDIINPNKKILARKEKKKRLINQFNIESIVDKVNSIKCKNKKKANEKIFSNDNLQDRKDFNLHLENNIFHKNTNSINEFNKEMNNDLNFFKKENNFSFKSNENLKLIDKNYNKNDEISKFEIIGLSKEIKKKKEKLKLNQNIFMNSEFDRKLNKEHENEFSNSNKFPKKINYKNDLKFQSYFQKEKQEEIIENNSAFQNYNETYYGFQKKKNFENLNNNDNFLNEFNKFNLKAKFDNSINNAKSNLNFEKPITSLLSHSGNVSDPINLKEKKIEKLNLFFTNDQSIKSNDSKVINNFNTDFIKSNNSFDFVQKNLKIPNMNLNLNFNLNVNLNVNLKSNNEKDKNSENLESFQYPNESSFKNEDQNNKGSATGKNVNSNNFTNIFNNNTTNNFIFTSVNDTSKEKKSKIKNHYFNHIKNQIDINEKSDLKNKSNILKILEKKSNITFGSDFLTNSKFKLNHSWEKQQSLLGLKRNNDSRSENKSYSGDNYLNKKIINSKNLIGQSDLALKETANKYINFPNYNNPKNSSLFNLNNFDNNKKINKNKISNFDSQNFFKSNNLSESAKNHYYENNSVNHFDSYINNKNYKDNFNNKEFKNFRIKDEIDSFDDNLNSRLFTKSSSNKIEGINVKDNTYIQISTSKNEKNKNCLFKQSELLNENCEKNGTLTDSLSSDNEGDIKNKNIFNIRNNGAKEILNKNLFVCKNEGVKNFTENGLQIIQEKKEINKDFISEKFFKNSILDINNNPSCILKISDLSKQNNNNYININKDNILNKNNPFTNLIINKKFSEDNTNSYSYNNKNLTNIVKFIPKNLEKSIKSNTLINNDDINLFLNKDSNKYSLNITNSNNKNNQILEKINRSSSDLSQSSDRIVYNNNIFNKIQYSNNNNVNIIQNTNSILCKENSFIFSGKNYNNNAEIINSLKKAENSETNELFKNYKNTNNFNSCSLNNNKNNNFQDSNKFLFRNNLNSGDKKNINSNIDTIYNNINNKKTNNTISGNLSNYDTKIQSPLKKDDEKDKKLSEFNLDDFFVYHD